MEAVKQRLSRSQAYGQRFVTWAWYALRSPKVTVSLVAVAAVVALLGLVLPQQSEAGGGGDGAERWVASLPLWLQPWGDLLYFLGLARIFQTPWFWLPVALLLLNSLIALADYGPGSWRRSGKSGPPIDWQHPLAHRVERSVRLPGEPDAFRAGLGNRLQAKGYSLYQVAESEQRVTSAGRRRWSWLGVVAMYVGLIGLIGAFIISYYAAQTERFTLQPSQARSTPLVGGELELTAGEGLSRGSLVTFTPKQAGASAQLLVWRLYQPALLNGALIWPISIDPTLTIEMRDAADEPLILVPLQAEVSREERLSLPLDRSNTPLYVVIPAEDMAVQISPEAGTDDLYHVQVRRGSGSPTPEEVRVQVGETFTVEGASGEIFLDHNVTVVAHRDPGWWLYLISGILTVVGGGLSWWRAPSVVWLIPEVKGMGGQLYGVMEKLGSGRGMEAFLETVLAGGDPSEEENGDR
jgi:hypothetical protein